MLIVSVKKEDKVIQKFIVMDCQKQAVRLVCLVGIELNGLE